MLHLQHLQPKRTLNRISSRFSVRRLRRHLGPKLKDKPLNLTLSLFRRSAIQFLLPHPPRIGMSAITGTIPFHPCNRMFGVPPRMPCLLNNQLCLVREAKYGEDPQVQALAPSGHQRQQGARKQTRRMCLETSGAVSSRPHLTFSALWSVILRAWESIREYHCNTRRCWPNHGKVHNNGRRAREAGFACSERSGYISP